jgi:hypothetical protein
MTRRIESKRFIPFNWPGQFRARCRELQAQGWRIIAILRPTDPRWLGRWACLFLER